MGECLFKEKALPRALFKTFSEKLNCSRRMKSRGAALHKCSRRVGAPVSGRKPKYTQGGTPRGGGAVPSRRGCDRQKPPRDDKKTERRQKNPRDVTVCRVLFYVGATGGAHAAVIFHAVPSDKPRRVFGSGGVEGGPSKKPPPRRIVLINRKCRGSGRCRRG